MIAHMAKVGRPSKYSQELADIICTRLASGESMRSVCRDAAMPVMDTMWRWIREKRDFSEQYAVAKQESADALIEDILDIADDSAGDVPRDRLRIDARKWIASPSSSQRSMVIRLPSMLTQVVTSRSLSVVILMLFRHYR